MGQTGTHESTLNCAGHTVSAQETSCCSYCPLGSFRALSLPQVEHCLKCISHVLGYLSQPQPCTGDNPGLWPLFPDGQQIQGTQEVFSKHLLPPKSLSQGPGADQIPSLSAAATHFQNKKGLGPALPSSFYSREHTERNEHSGTGNSYEPLLGRGLGRPAGKQKLSLKGREC